MQRPSTSGEAVDIDALLETPYDFRQAYQAIDHPAKEQVLITLASLTVDPNYGAEARRPEAEREYAHAQIGDIAYHGTRYFSEAAWRLGRKRAKDAEHTRLKAEYDAMSATERVARQISGTRHIKINDADLEIATADLPVAEVIECMVAQQMQYAFDVAYQGSTRLPAWAPRSLNSRDALSIMFASGAILARQMGELTPEQYLETMTHIGGNASMVRNAYADLARGISFASAYVRDGQPAAYDFTLGEAGYILFRSRPRAGKYLLSLAGLFWPGVKERDIDESTAFPAEEPERPNFTEEDAVHMCEGAADIQRLITFKDYFPLLKLSPELFAKIIKNIPLLRSGNLLEDSDYPPTFEQLVNAFGLDKVADPSGYVRELVQAGHSDIIWEYYRMFRQEHLPALDIFRANIDSETFSFTQAILDGALTEEHAALGISECGSKGIEQLKAAIRNIETFLLADSRSPENIRQEIERIQNSSLYARLWRVAVRFNVTTWGSKNTGEIVRVLEDAARMLEGEDVPPLNTKVYKPQSQVMVRERISEHGSINAEVMGLIGRFSEMVEVTITKPEAFGTFEERIAQFKEALFAAIGKIDGLLESGDHTDEKRLALQKERTAILEVFETGFEDMLRTEGSFVAACQAIGHLRMARGILREKALRDAHHSLGDTLKVALDELRPGGSAEQRVIAMLNAVDHVLVREYLLKLNPGDKGYERFVTRVLFNTSVVNTALQKAMNRAAMAQDSSMIARHVLKFIPTRDIGLELSGQIGDACWASKYGSIAEQMPNISAVLFAETRDDTESLVGSGLLLEATSESGEQLLIVRGLNPIQNFIGEVDPYHFLATFLEYARETAQRAGRKLAMVYDHSGGASTNRPTLFGAMTAYIEDNQLSTIRVPEDQVSFNGYDLKGCVYLVE